MDKRIRSYQTGMMSNMCICDDCANDRRDDDAGGKVMVLLSEHEPFASPLLSFRNPPGACKYCRVKPGRVTHSNSLGYQAFI